MINDSDLSHISKQIQHHTAEIEATRLRAGNERIIASQKYEDGGDQNAAYFEKEAIRLDTIANNLEDEVKQLEEAKRQKEARLQELEQEKIRAEAEYKDRLSKIETEKARLRGTGAML